LGFVEGLYDLVWPEVECDLAGAIRDYFADQERVARANNPFPAGVLYEDIFSRLSQLEDIADHGGA
jgi:hypothetical protein